MNKPSVVIRLIEELEGEGLDSRLDTTRSTKLVIFVDENDDEGFSLNAKETAAVLASVDTAQRLVDCIDKPSQASIALFDVWPEDDVLGVLERNFAAVDEG